MAIGEIKSRLQYLEKRLPLVIERERNAIHSPSVPALRIPESAIIKREIKRLRLMLAE